MKKFDAFMDILIIGTLLYTLLMLVQNPLMDFVFALVGFAAIFNNLKILFKDVKFKKKNKKDKKKEMK